MERDKQLPQEMQSGTPRGSLIPPVHSTRAPSPVRNVHEGGQKFNEPPRVMTTEMMRGLREPERRFTLKSPLSPDRKSQKEERDSVIDVVRQITGALKEVPRQERISIGGTPEYDWDTRYDGIQGFSSHLKNRVNEPGTPQEGQSPRGGLRTPPNPKDSINN